jgi:DNA-binding FrmR family transcriptional regulator
VHIDQPASAVVNRRLRRAAGQLHGIIGMLEAGRDCDDVLTQIAAVSHAVNRAAYLVIVDQLRQCATARTGQTPTATIAEVEQAFQALG